MGVITDYLTLQQEQQLKYGSKTALLYQIGSFYECYEYNTDYCTSKESKYDKSGKIWNESIGHAIQLSTVLNCHLAFENNNMPYGINNPHKIGFPTISYEKNKNTLLCNDYTVIRVDQRKEDKKVTRFIAEVCSPTMNLENIGLNRISSNIASIYIEYQKGSSDKCYNFLITTGISVVDIITGSNRICEFHSKLDDQVHAIQELYRFLISHYPRELIVNIVDIPDPIADKYVKYIEKALELHRFDRLDININKVPNEYKRPVYQTEFFNKIFKQETNGMLMSKNEKIIDHLGLTVLNYGRISYLLLLQHCYTHNSDIISRLSKPDINWLDEKNHLILTHNALVQLEIIPKTQRTKQLDSLISILDQNKTSLGKRLLTNIIQNPMCISSNINIYYDMIDEMLNNTINNEFIWLYLDKALRELPDIGRLQRKLELRLISPKEISVLFNAYLKIINIYTNIIGTKLPVIHKSILDNETINSFNSFIARFYNLFDFKALEYCDIDTAESGAKWLLFTNNPIKTGFFPDLDDKCNKLVEAENTLQSIVDHLNTFLKKSSGKKLEFRSAKKKQGATKQDPTGTIITTTTSKAKLLENSYIDQELCGELQINTYTSAEKIITSSKITNLCNEIDDIKLWMRNRLYQIYDAIINEMVTKYTFYVPVASSIAKLDLIHSYAKVSYQNNYYRPEFIEGDDSVIQVKELRHPIIERIIDGVYVTNDVSLGPDMNSNGMLLFGINTAGKSSMAKALGVNIIMAQAGCYTASKLKYRPYKKIITRLTGGDNLLKGESSFEVEMSELRTILRQSDNNTLAIGDEIASGTESNSATAITGSAIKQLLKKNTTFIFATHMHELLKLSSIKNIPTDKLRICHLAINYDESSKTLLYDRKLKDGAGSSSYGLMVTKSLGLPDVFIEDANDLLLELTKKNKEILPTKKSRYNAKVYMDECVKCGKNSNEIELHTHHIIEQVHAVDSIVKKINDNGVVGSMHKNKKGNLIVLCKICHMLLHSNKQELETVQSPNGIQVRFSSQ